jgi:hypothetical protein
MFAMTVGTVSVESGHICKTCYMTRHVVLILPDEGG